jgi:cytochrome c oxidase subunit 3
VRRAHESPALGGLPVQLADDADPAGSGRGRRQPADRQQRLLRQPRPEHGLREAHAWYAWLPLWNTIILLSSSVTVHFAHMGLLDGDRKKFNTFLAVTVALGYIFIGLQIAEYYEAYAHFGLTLNSGIYGSTFFMLTGFHGFHVLMGSTMLAIQLYRSVRNGHFTATDHFGFEGSSWYWHFVDVVWVFLFLFVYIL